MAYASQLLNGKRTPSRALAFSIFERTGRKFGPLASLSDDDVRTLARIEATIAPAESSQVEAA